MAQMMPPQSAEIQSLAVCRLPCGRQTQSTWNADCRCRPAGPHQITSNASVTPYALRVR